MSAAILLPHVHEALSAFVSIPCQQAGTGTGTETDTHTHIHTHTHTHTTTHPKLELSRAVVEGDICSSGIKNIKMKDNDAFTRNF